MKITYDNVVYWIEQQTDNKILLDVNRRVCSRARAVIGQKAQEQMVKFHIGQRVKSYHKTFTWGL